MIDNNHHSESIPLADWLAGGGETGQFIRQKDWSQTPLGPIDTWPQSLRTTVSICLASNFPINIIWGPQRVQIYNDGYRPICGDKHPISMGQDYKECWYSAWDAIGEPFENASAGETDFLVNQRMFLDRNGYLEETFFTFSLSPIRDESGGIGGLFHPVNETTPEMVGERRLKVLRELADQTVDAKTVTDASQLIGETLTNHAFDVPFALLYLLDADGKQARLAGSAGLTSGLPASPLIINLDALEPADWPLGEALRTRQVVVVNQLNHRFELFKSGPYPESPHTALVLPIQLSGLNQPFGFLVAGVSSRRALDDAYHTFYLMLRESVTNALTNARAYEEERKRAEALAAIDQAKTAFFSNVSHEFRTPLTLMMGPLEDTLAEGGLPPTIYERLKVAHRNSQRLLKLVNSLLDFSRIEAGRIEAVFEPVDLATFTADLASVFRSAIERAGMELIVDCPPLSQPVYVDREMWEKIIFNLLSNAFKFTFEGTITLSLRPAGKEVLLSVSDTGTGIPANELPHLFERFHRVKGARGRSYEGSGIGLALVAELVKLHGGRVGAQSEVGRGSTFTVTLPVGKTHLPADRLGAERMLESTGLRGEAYLEEALRWLPETESNGLDLISAPATGLVQASRQTDPLTTPARVLLVDDNTDMREYVRQLLNGRYTVVTAPDGEAALSVVREQPFDLVLTDVMMPKLDGFGLLKALRTDERTRAIPVILLSARAGEESRVEGLEAGADDYLIKPFSARELLARVEAHLSLQRLRQKSERAIRERTEQFETLLNEAPLGVYVVDADLRIQQVNPMARQILGPTAESDDFAAIIHQLWPPQPAEELIGRVRHTLDTGESTLVPEPLEMREQRSKAEYYEWQLNRIPLPDNRIGVVCYIHDISARVVAQQAVAESEEAFRLLIMASSDSLYRMSADWSEMQNLQGMNFLSNTDRPNADWLQAYIPPADQARTQAVINEAIRTKTPFELEHQVMLADGRIGWTFSRAIPLLDAQGEIREWFGAASDITARKQAEQALLASEGRYRQLSEELEQQVQQRTEQLQILVGDLQRSNENLEQFAYVASHDLQEPLRKIQQFGDLLQTQYAESLGNGSSYLHRMQSAASRMSVLIKDLLNYSRIATGQQATALVSLNEVLNAVLSDLDLVISETRAQISVEDLPTLVGDSSQLGQLFGNLLSNALKFGQPGQVTSVRVSAHRTAAIDLPASVKPTRVATAYHRIDVADNGIGFDEKYLDRIFQVFQRLHTKNTYGGTGIGLAICEKVVSNHGGGITASSRPGQGATFSVYLPI